MSSHQMLCCVRVSTSNSNFVRLPQKFSPSLCLNIGGVSVVQILSTDNDDPRSCFCSVSSTDLAVEKQEVELGLSVKEVLGDQERVLVRRPAESEVGQAVTVIVSPSSQEDWQVLQLNQSKLERCVLDQVRVVQAGQVLRLSLARGLPLHLLVMEVRPNREAVVLQQMTDLVIQVPEEFSEDTDVDKEEISGNNNNTDGIQEDVEMQTKKVESTLLSRLIQPISNLFESWKEKDFKAEDRFRQEFSNTPVKGSYRAHQFSTSQPYCCFIAKVSLPEIVKSSFIARLTKIPSPTQLEGDSHGGYKTTHVKIRVTEREDILPGRIYMSDNLLKWHNIPLTSQVFIESVVFQDTFVNNMSEILKLSVSKGKGSTEKALTDLEKCLLKDSQLFPASSLIEVNDCIFQIQTEANQQFVWVSKGSSVKIVNNFSPTEDFPVSNVEESFKNNKNLVDSEIFHNEVTDCTQYLQTSLLLNDHYFQPTHLLILGPSGSGKTSLMLEISTFLGRSKEVVSSRLINCVTLRGKRLDVVKKLVQKELSDLEYSAPGLLLLDNIDSLAPSPTEERPETEEISNNVASWISNLILDITHRRCPTVVVATARSTSSLNPLLLPSKGRFPFRKQVNLNGLDRGAKSRLMTFFLGVGHLELPDNFFSLTEGFQPSDLRRLAERVLTKHDKLCSESLEKELKEFVPLSRWGKNLRPTQQKKMEDVGSLDNAKEVLIRTLLWPAKYQEVFSKVGVRLPRGILLYGAPGTGKTLLAEAIGSHTGLNFILVKGPELLSKYIGASEGNVRDLFDRAQAVSPSIIFFDEFDSLAPRRGHDSTGVTDRVVNQLLTQLDGVEGLDGVWVMAASSRPDLIDPALLRPGRLDKMVECPLPDQAGRLNILKVLSRDLVLGLDVELQEVAELTEGLTGADLKALLYTAQLNSHKANQLDSHMVDSENLLDEVVVDQTCLVEAARNTCRSVTLSEARRYENIYAAFKRGAQREDLSAPEQRTTLA